MAPDTFKEIEGNAETPSPTKPVQDTSPPKSAEECVKENMDAEKGNENIYKTSLQENILMCVHHDLHRRGTLIGKTSRDCFLYRIGKLRRYRNVTMQYTQKRSGFNFPGSMLGELKKKLTSYNSTLKFEFRNKNVLLVTKNYCTCTTHLPNLFIR